MQDQQQTSFGHLFARFLKFTAGSFLAANLPMLIVPVLGIGLLGYAGMRGCKAARSHTLDRIGSTVGLPHLGTYDQIRQSWGPMQIETPAYARPQPILPPAPTPTYASLASQGHQQPPTTLAPLRPVPPGQAPMHSFEPLEPALPSQVNVPPIVMTDQFSVELTGLERQGRNIRVLFRIQNHGTDKQITISGNCNTRTSKLVAPGGLEFTRPHVKVGNKFDPNCVKHTFLSQTYVDCELTFQGVPPSVTHLDLIHIGILCIPPAQFPNVLIPEAAPIVLDKPESILDVPDLKIEDTALAGPPDQELRPEPEPEPPVEAADEQPPAEPEEQDDEDKTAGPESNDLP